ncbi:MAG: VWA domain-containing protein [Dehalococcoidia bacterium]|nr:VWA domain-containing protein [Dehalococcoidia bacterium]
MLSYRYTKWDASQGSSGLHHDELMEELSDHLLSQGDLNSAMRTMMQRGLHGKPMGLQELLQKLRSQRQGLLEKYNLGGLLDEVKKGLQDVVDAEKDGIEKRVNEARDQTLQGRKNNASGETEVDLSLEEAQNLMDYLEKMASEKKEYLDALPSDLGKKLKSLGDYEFMDQGAQEKYRELVEKLQGEVSQSIFDQLRNALEAMGQGEMDQLRAMVRRMNQMLKEKLKGIEPDFDAFKAEFEDMLEENGPQSLDELLNGVGERVQMMQSLMESLSAQQRGTLGDIIEQMMQQMGMRDEVAEMGKYLEELLDWDRPRRYPFRGEESLSLKEGLNALEDLGAMDNLERQLRAAQFGEGIGEVDTEKVRDLLGEEEASSVEDLKDIGKRLEEAGYLRKEGGKYELTPRGARKIGQKALKDIFDRIKKDRYGGHSLERNGVGLEVVEDNKIYEYGDAFLLDLEKTVLNAIERSGPGIPVRLDPKDFEVHRTEQMSQCSTVLMLDLSWSMARRGSFFAAKKVALALHNLISTQFPRDKLSIIGFSTYARELKASQLPYITWDQAEPYTNMQQGFIVSQRLLSRQKGGTKQIILISDGEPTAHVERGQIFLGYPPSPRTIRETLKEVRHCTRQGIIINTFMLDRSYYLKEFVNQMTRINRGRAFYTSPDKLGQYILVDYLSGKNKRIA